jgi:hypothetical protein
MNAGHVCVRVQVRAGVREVWAELTDWESQSAWITATRVRTVGGSGRGVGGRIEAFTGLGPLGVLDTMEITEWSPPTRCAVRHTGAVVRGVGAFEVTRAQDEADGSIVTWYEELSLPGGALGARCFALARPLVAHMVLRSLRRFARIVEQRAPRGERPNRATPQRHQSS